MRIPKAEVWPTNTARFLSNGMAPGDASGRTSGSYAACGTEEHLNKYPKTFGARILEEEARFLFFRRRRYVYDGEILRKSL